MFTSQRYLGTKTMTINGEPKGAWIYSINKNGERYANPTFYTWAGMDKTPEDVKKRMEELNPGKRFEVAENQDELNRIYA